MTTVQAREKTDPKPPTDKPVDKPADKKNGGAAKPKGEAKAAARALFEAFQVAEDAVSSSRSALEKAMVARSLAVAAIKEAFGTGPFSWRGRTVTITSRTTKAAEGETPTVAYFFKSVGGAVQTIE